jgi:hypothetical protein
MSLFQAVMVLTHIECTSSGTSSMIALPDLCKNSVRNFVMEVPSIIHLQEIFSRFQTKDKYSHGFLVGSTNHWSAMVGNRVDGHYELLYLDSRFHFK